MQDPKNCRSHALKCSLLADSLPQGSARQLFSEMAATWTRKAIEAEKFTPVRDQVLPRGNELYRFGSRVDTQDHSRRWPSADDV
jgi:hypothetical protein